MHFLNYDDFLKKSSEAIQQQRFFKNFMRNDCKVYDDDWKDIWRIIFLYNSRDFLNYIKNNILRLYKIS